MEKGQKVKFKEYITKDDFFILEGIIVCQTPQEYIIVCDRYPWKCDKEVVVRKPKADNSWLVE